MLDKTNVKVVMLTGLLGGFFGALVKWGSEIPMPPRIPTEISPPGANIDAWFGWLGINSHSLDYVYQTVTIPGAVILYHFLFCFIFAFVYVLISAVYPKIRLWYGVAYGIIITIVMHAIIIPILGFRIPAYLNGENGWIWNLNGYELWSEILGHIAWSVSIEICLLAVLALMAKPAKGYWTK